MADCGGRGEGFEVPEHAGTADAIFLRAAATEFLDHGGAANSNEASSRRDRGRAGAQDPRTGRQSGALRSDHPARASGEVDFGAAGGGHIAGGTGEPGAGSGGDRVVCGDVVHGIAEHAGDGVTHGARGKDVGCAEAGDVAGPGTGNGWRSDRIRRGTGIDTAPGKSIVSCEPARSRGVWGSVCSDGSRGRGGMHSAGLAGYSDGSDEGVARRVTSALTCLTEKVVG